MEPLDHPTPGRALFVRLIAYGGLIALAMWAYMKAVEASLAHPGLEDTRALLAEGGVLEGTQAAILALAFLIAVSPIPRPRQVLDLILALLVATALARELDDQLMRALFPKVHRLFMIVFLGAVLALAYAHRDRVWREVNAFVRRPGFYFLFFAALIAGSFAQVLGSTDTWRPLVGSEVASRMAKRFVEEGLESVAYLLIAIGLFEERWFRTGA